jgi:DNA-binding response OmpR family regulator
MKRKAAGWPVILVADDDQDILDLVRLRLTRVGYELLLAHDGREALELAREHVPDLAILDVSMPELDGYAVAKLLKRNPETAAIPVIMLTARAQVKEVEEGFAAGAHDYITKPFSPADLQARTAEVLARFAAAAEEPSTKPLRLAAGQ